MPSPANKGQKYPPEPLTHQEVLRLMSIPNRRYPTGARNRALIAVLYRSGLRISEVLALRVADVDRDTGSVRVLHGKGDKSRTVGMDPKAFEELDYWLGRRKELGFNGTQPMFCTLHGRPISTAYIRRLLPRLAKKAGIEKRVHAHGLRHTLAAELRREGVDIGVISKQLGHSSIATTDKYLNHIAPEMVLQAMGKRDW